MSRHFFKNISSVKIDNCNIEQSFSQFFLAIIDLSLAEDFARFISKKLIKICSPVIIIAGIDAIDFLVKSGVVERDCCIPYPCDKDVFFRYIERLIKRFRNKTVNFIEERLKLVEKENTVSESIQGYFNGKSPAIVKARKQIEEAAKQDSSVLLLGETGTGKTTAAALIHNTSSRGVKPLIRIKCEDIVESMAVSTLFGSVKGSYTNATKDVEGRIISGNGGTLFFDEFGCLSFETQSLFITFTEDKIFSKLGSNKAEKVDARMIFATNIDIRKNMEEGKFRPDVYFRIAKREIFLPSLRERKEDIPILINDYCKKYNLSVDDIVYNLLMGYHWPGNLRQFYTCLDNARENCEDNRIRYKDIDLGYLARDYYLPNLS